MPDIMKFIPVLIIFLLLYGCSKENNTNTPPQQKVQQDDSDTPVDTNLTPEEKFSSSILFDFLNGAEDEELADYLETEIYKMGANYTGASVVEISPAIWFVMLEKDGNTKNYLLQKFVNFNTNDYYFRLKETNLTITDIISKSRIKTPAGE